MHKKAITWIFLKKSFYNGVKLMNNVVLVLGVQQKFQLYIYMHPLKKFFSHLGYYRVLSRFPCAIQQVFVSYLFLTIVVCTCNWILWASETNGVWLGWRMLANISVICKLLSWRKLLRVRSSFFFNRAEGTLQHLGNGLQCPLCLPPTAVQKIQLRDSGLSDSWNRGLLFPWRKLAVRILCVITKSGG